MASDSAPEDLALHGVRVLGFPTAARVAARYGLDEATVHELLLDLEATGHVRQLAFADLSGWSLTDRGRVEGERRLAAELDRTGARDAVSGVHAAFLPLNRSFGQACTAWQVRPTREDPMALNDHTDPRWDARALAALADHERAFARLCGELAELLSRFGGYAPAYRAALDRVRAGDHAWVDAPDRDGLHVVWIQFHEDLLATLGIPRGTDG